MDGWTIAMFEGADRDLTSCISTLLDLNLTGNRSAMFLILKLILKFQSVSTVTCFFSKGMTLGKC